MTARELINKLRKLCRMVGKGEIQAACEFIDSIIDEVKKCER